MRALRAARHEFTFPSERMSNDGRKMVETGLPAECRPCLAGIGNDPRGIAAASRRNLNLEIDARDTLNRLDHFKHRKAVAVAAIERRPTGSQVAQGVEMGVHQVADMDVVADTGAVGRRVIRAENL
jgi:hypothetical protein